MSFSKGFRLWSGRVGIGAAVLLSLSAAYAYRFLSARPGEGALRFVPSDALALVSIDLSPSAGQVVTFKRIDDALARNGLDGVLQKSFIDGIAEPKLASAIRPYALRAGAFAMLPPASAGAKNEDMPLGFLSLSDGPAVNTALTKSLSPLFYRGLRYYRLNRGNMFATVIEDQFVFSNNPKALYRARQVALGDVPPMIKTEFFASARAKIAGDANILAMISPDLINQFGNKKTKGTLASWMNLGVSVRPDGIALDCDGKYNAESNAAMKQIMAIKPLRSDLFNVLPDGAYGVIALSSPATFVDAGMNQIQDGKDHEKFEADFPKNIGLDYRRDFLTALQGDAVIAAYPGTSEAGDEGPSGMNLLLVVDNSNGGDPAAPVAKFADWVNSKMRENKDMPQTALFVAKPIDGGQEYSLSASYQDKLQDSLGEGSKNSPFHQAKLTADKTVVWATLDHTVLAATSKATLDRAIEAYRAHSGTFAKDADLGTSAAHILDGSQALLMLSPSRIAKGIENTMSLDKMSPEDRKSAHEVFALFDGLTAPLTIYGGCVSTGEGRSGAFIPIDYDKTIDFIGSKMNKK